MRVGLVDFGPGGPRERVTGRIECCEKLTDCANESVGAALAFVAWLATAKTAVRSVIVKCNSAGILLAIWKGRDRGISSECKRTDGIRLLWHEDKTATSYTRTGSNPLR
jgi:hypothetical protein